jgi:DNA-binding response OmpR family regulator
MPSILLVEDDRQLRAMLKALLDEKGYEVLEADSGVGVDDLYKVRHPDLVVTDIVMPGKEGLELIRDLQGQDGKVRIIAISGAGPGKAECYLKLAQKLGARSTLCKPFSSTEFLQAICIALGSKSPADSSQDGDGGPAALDW